LTAAAACGILTAPKRAKQNGIMRLYNLLNSKIHRATVTEANVEYVGSITVDRDLMDHVGLLAGELVHVWDVDNGERFETYALEGARGSGTICVNGAAALRVSVGHRVIICAFVLTDEPVEPRIILVDPHNKFTIHVPMQSAGGQAS
jgi:aspartate 1-decarboxylase